MAKKSFAPFADNVMVLPPPKRNTTETGIVIPDTVEKEKPQVGHVVAVGPGRLLDDGTLSKMHVKVGQTVLFGSYTGVEVEIGNKTYLIIKQDDLLLAELVEETPEEEEDDEIGLSSGIGAG